MFRFIVDLLWLEVLCLIVAAVALIWMLKVLIYFTFIIFGIRLVAKIIAIILLARGGGKN